MELTGQFHSLEDTMSVILVCIIDIADGCTGH